ncbi:hypothetical protein D9M71_693440 [compost metagenome]
MKQTGNNRLGRLVTLTLHHLQQRRFSGRHLLEKRQQPLTDVLTDTFRPPIGIAFTDLDWRKEEHRLRPLDSRQPGLIGALCRAGKAAVDQPPGKMPVHPVT